MLREYLKRSSKLGIPIVYLLLACFSGCGGEPPAEMEEIVRPVKTIVVGGGAAGRLSYPGTVQAAERVELSFRVPGPLIQFPVNEGQRVARGQLLARIDPRDFEIAVQQAQAEFKRADSDYQRYQRLYEREAVPLSDLELYRAQRDVARARLDNAQANLKDTYLRAPFGGEIGEKYVENFEDVRAKQPILGLHAVDSIEIVVDIPEAVRARFNPDRQNPLKITASFGFLEGREFDLEFKEVSASADPRTQTYRVTFSMLQPQGVSIRPGMTAEVTAVASQQSAGETPSAFVVPARAVNAAEDGSQQVWVVNEDMIVKSRPVKVGEATGRESIWILEGLAAGERIAVAGVNNLRDGMRVRVMDNRSE